LSRAGVGNSRIQRASHSPARKTLFRLLTYIRLIVILNYEKKQSPLNIQQQLQQIVALLGQKLDASP
jgi:hypothetical protein